ncbi:nucleoside hydrolase [Shigella flexneri]
MAYSIHRLVIMGGSAGRGNFTPNAEFNMLSIPRLPKSSRAAGIVMCGLDVTNQAMLAPDYLATLPKLNQTGRMLHALFSHYRSGSMNTGLRMHDLCAIAWLVRPELFTLQSCFVAVETKANLPQVRRWWISRTSGHPANAQVALGLNVEGFQQWVAEVLHWCRTSRFITDAVFRRVMPFTDISACLSLNSNYHVFGWRRSVALVNLKTIYVKLTKENSYA